MTDKINKNDYLTTAEKVSIKTLNYIATYDGIIQSSDDIIYLLNRGIEKFIPKSRRHLVQVSENSYPIKIVIVKKP